MMKRIGILAAIALLALGLAASALAGTATGTTTILGASGVEGTPPTPPNYDGKAHADTPTDVQVSIITTAPVVPYDYSLINKCWFSGKTSGPSDSFERFDLAGPWFAPNPGDPPTMIVSVNVQPVPVGATCKVYLIKNNTVVKGSTTVYSVVP